jgi:tetratricopeptide (TPR) repeat protein
VVERFLKLAEAHGPTSGVLLETPTHEEFTQGRAAEARGAWDQAIASYMENLRKHPEDAATYLRLGYCFQVGKGDSVRAGYLYQEVLNRYPTCADGWLFMAFVLQALGQKNDAANAYFKARLYGHEAVLKRYPELMARAAAPMAAPTTVPAATGRAG